MNVAESVAIKASIERLVEYIQQLEKRIEALEAKRGPGRPPIEKAA